MKILLALDVAPSACETIAAVKRMFGGTEASVVALSVVGPNELESVPSPVLLSSVAQKLSVLEDDQVRTHEKIVAHAVDTLRAAGLDASGEVEHGNPSQVIVKTARSRDVELVVVGCHGRPAARRRPMGRVASYVASHAPCDVLVVRHKGEG